MCAQSELYCEKGLGTTGVFEKRNTGEASGYATVVKGPYDGFIFRASNGDSTYSGSKLQPPALQVLACIRC